MAIPTILAKLDKLEKAVDSLSLGGAPTLVRDATLVRDDVSNEIVARVANLEKSLNDLQNETVKINAIFDRLSQIEQKLEIQPVIVERLQRLEETQVPPTFITDKIASLENTIQTAVPSLTDRIIEIENKQQPSDLLERFNDLDARVVPQLSSRVKELEHIVSPSS